LGPPVDPPSIAVVSPAEPPPEQTLAEAEVGRWGGTGPFTAVAFSPDTRLALAAGTDHALRLWDLEAGREMGRLTGHHDDVLGLAISRDGKRAVSGGKDRLVRVWDLEGLTMLRALPGHEEEVSAVVYTWDPRHAFSAGRDGRLILWEVNGLAPKDEFTGGPRLTAAAITGLGRYVACGTAEGELRLYDVDRKVWKQYRTLAGAGAEVLALTWGRDNRFLLSGGSDGAMRLYRVPEEHEVVRYAGHDGGVTS